jgi:hypothetical protein
MEIIKTHLVLFEEDSMGRKYSKICKVYETVDIIKGEILNYEDDKIIWKDDIETKIVPRYFLEKVDGRGGTKIEEISKSELDEMSSKL